MNTTGQDGVRAAAHLRQWELASRWHLSGRTLEKWRTLGIGPAYIKIGGRVRYLLSDVEAYEAAQRQGGR